MILLRMNKIVDFGRRALFVIRVLSGYEERRVRTLRLQLQQRIEQAQVRKDALRKVPEQLILKEVRRVVEEMQTLNRQLEETESAIDEYFKPIDKSAETLMNMQLDKEEKNMKEMAKAMREEVLRQRAAAEQIASASSESNLVVNCHDKELAANSTSQQQGT